MATTTIRNTVTKSRPPRIPEPRPLRLAVAAGSYVSQRDGVSVYTENLLASLETEARARGMPVDVDIYAAGHSAAVLESMLEQQIGEPGDGLRHRMVRIPGESAWDRYVSIPRRIGRNGPYDCVLMPNLQPVWLPGQRSVAVLHDLTYRVASDHFTRWRVRYMDLLTRWHLHADRAIGLISRTSEADLTRNYPAAASRRRLFMPNGLPEKLAATPRISGGDAERKIRADHLHLLYVGRMNRLKGFDRVQGVCRMLDELLARRGGKATLHLVGKPTPETAALMPGPGLARVEVVRHGFLGDADLNALYRRSAFCLFLSRNEGFGLPLMEAIWQRCVPLLSEIPIFREVMGPRYPLFNDGGGGLASLTAFIDRVREDGDYRRGILSEAEAALQRWEHGYGEAASNLLDWVTAEARAGRHIHGGIA